ncbi:MAG: PASTA domain-containing protein [Clostridia bacterium]|nr:PASTA domain-containing protein [Clostridia bacterium]
MKARTKSSTKKRISAILLLFLFFTSYLLYNIFYLGYVKHDYYKEKTYDQITTTSPLPAKRGNIYDSNMKILATSNTEWRISVSTRDIRAAEKKDGKDYTKIISIGIGKILSMNTDKLYNKIKNANVLDVTIKKRVEEKEYRQILSFLEENDIEELVFCEAGSSRSYPEGTFLAHALGFTGSDNQGLYGLEYYYDDTLSGTDGYYVYAKDANGNALDTEYSDYFPAKDGCSLVTTIDSYLQTELESIIEEARVNHAAQNRVCGVVMDTNTGAILAMATTSPFDPNDPFTLDEISAQKLVESGLVNGTEEYNAYKTSLMQTMWSNKVLSETYEPGSTFKIITVASALDFGAVTARDTFSCSGSCSVGGWNIRCHKRTGHGSGFSLAYGLQMSCNPCMIAVSERLGADNFYSYVKNFGYLEKTGIDLPGEAGAIFHNEGSIGTTELATASFGQRFKVSIINHLTAISAVANGGKLVTPYIVDKIIDSDGNIISQHETEIKRQVISESAANTVSKMLIEGVSGDGGAKNAGVVGYDIAAKTGTSEKFDILDENGNSYLRIGSTVAYATDSDTGIAVIIVVDEPTSEVKYGSVVAAPYVSLFLEKALPYLEYKSTSDSQNVTVENYVGMSVDAAKKKLSEAKIAYEIVGKGSVVLSQTPSANTEFSAPVSRVILYTEKNNDSQIKVPNLVGLSVSEGMRLAVNSGLNIKFSGGTTAVATDNIYSQSIAPGEMVKRGTVICIRILTTDFED